MFGHDTFFGQSTRIRGKNREFCIHQISHLGHTFWYFSIKLQHTWLPQEQEKVFRLHLQELEPHYAMMSVSLNEALELRYEQRIGQSLQAVRFSSELCLLLAGSLSGLLRALYEHAKHYGTIPNAVPLDPANFQGQNFFL